MTKKHVVPHLGGKTHLRKLLRMKSPKYYQVKTLNNSPSLVKKNAGLGEKSKHLRDLNHDLQILSLTCSSLS